MNNNQVSKQKYHFVPINLNLNDLNVILTGKAGTSILLHKVLCFYTLLMKRMINNILFEEDNTKWIYINRKERRCLLGEKYVEVTEKLVEANLLLEDPKWIHNENGIGNHTKKYALPSWLLKGNKLFKYVKITGAKSVMNRITKYNNIRLTKTSENKWRNEMIRSSYRIMLHDTEESRADIQHHIDKVNNSNKKFQLKLSAEDMIAVFNHCAIQEGAPDLFGKRAFTKITSLPSNIRKHLYFENRPTEKLVCVDIVNSQPVFMSIANTAIIDRFTPELHEAKVIVAKFQNHESVIRFRNVCADGTIYESIIEYFKENGIIIDRKQAKPVAYSGFFGNYLWLEIGKLKKEFKILAYKFLQTQYNGVYRMFKEMKKVRWEANMNGKVYANNCMLAQRLESQIFYTVIVPAIWEYGYKDFSTIHDSIILPESDADVIKSIMMNEFKKLNIRLQLAA